METILAVALAILITFGWPALLLIPIGISEMFSSKNDKAPIAGNTKEGEKPASGCGVLALGVGFLALIALLFVAFAATSTTGPPRTPHPYWDEGDGRAIRDEQEYYQGRIPR